MLLINEINLEQHVGYVLRLDAEAVFINTGEGNLLS
jgi:hypothetical protein